MAKINKIESFYLKVLIVNESEVFITNLKSVIKILNKALRNEIVFINVTSGLSVPEIMPNLNPDLKEMFGQRLTLKNRRMERKI